MSRLGKHRKALLALAGVGILVLVAIGAQRYFKQRAAQRTRELIVGKWEVVGEKTARGVEFRGDGTFRMTFAKQLPYEGTYVFVGRNLIELRVPDETGATTVHVRVNEEQMTLKSEGATEGSTWKPVQEFAAGLNHPNGKSSALQEAWIVGSWQYIGKNEDGEVTANRLEIFADGTFSHLSRTRGLSFVIAATRLHMGNYRFVPRTDNFVEITYCDSGNTKTIYAGVTQEELVLNIGGSGEAKFQRVKDDRQELRTTRDDGVWTGFSLYREFKKHGAAADKQYRGKQLKVAGVVGGKMVHMSDQSAVVYLYSGEWQCIRCEFADPPKVLKAWLKNEGLGKTLRIVIEGTYAGMYKEREGGSAELVEMFTGLKGLQPTMFEQLVVYLKDCHLLEMAQVLLPGEFEIRHRRPEAPVQQDGGRNRRV
jgi:hypothetical protein